jgi:predicted DNA binding CopG/RHH family protein
MKKDNSTAKSKEEFDRRFDDGEDINDLIDMSKAKITRHGKKVRITLDVAEELVKDIDQVRERIGVDRGALIKVWLHEKVREEKEGRTKKTGV